MNWRRKRERDLQRELDAHLDLETEEQGDRYPARKSLGNTTSIKEDTRAMWGWGSFERLWKLMKLPVAGADRRVIVRQQNEQCHIENCCFKYTGSGGGT